MVMAQIKTMNREIVITNLQEARKVIERAKLAASTIGLMNRIKSIDSKLLDIIVELQTELQEEKEI
jgi:hypothetical protein